MPLEVGSGCRGEAWGWAVMPREMLPIPPPPVLSPTVPSLTCLGEPFAGEFYFGSLKRTVYGLKSMILYRVFRQGNPVLSSRSAVSMYNPRKQEILACSGLRCIRDPSA